LLTASALLIDFGSCAANETQSVVDVPDSNLTAYYPEVQPADDGWHKVDPAKPLSRPIKVRVNGSVFNIEFVASPDVGRSAVTLIDGWNQGCQFNISVEKLKVDGRYVWALMQKAPGDKDFYGVSEFSESSGTLRVTFPVDNANKTKNKIRYWVENNKTQESEVRCVMSTQNAIDDTIHAEQKIASIELSTKTLPGDGKEMPIVRFTSDEPVDNKNAAHGVAYIGIIVAATVFMQMLLTTLRD
ncbi:hypothetical protein AAVH_35558, partial [Aphelenchoides avenae]